MINRVILVGRLTKDPELRRTSNDIPVATFTLAVNRPFSNPSGDRDADFIPCVVWRRQAENVEQYLSKGSLVGVDGRIQTRTYDDQDGNRKYITEVVCDSVQFLEPKSASENSTSYEPQSRPQPKKESSIPDIVTEDDLPF
jgi:single-strand DNA-binding protein